MAEKKEIPRQRGKTGKMGNRANKAGSDPNRGDAATGGRKLAVASILERIRENKPFIEFARLVREETGRSIDHRKLAQICGQPYKGSEDTKVRIGLDDLETIEAFIKLRHYSLFPCRVRPSSKQRTWWNRLLLLAKSKSSSPVESPKTGQTINVGIERTLAHGTAMHCSKCFDKCMKWRGLNLHSIPYC
jgi:hypothetical protein